MRSVEAPLVDDAWPLTSAQLLAAAKTKKSGAPGPDGWSGAEISHWPEHAWSIYLVLWNRWAQTDKWPLQLREYRHVFLPKRAQMEDSKALEALT